MTILQKQHAVYLPELFKQIDEASTREERKQLLLEYSNKNQIHYDTLKIFTELMWHPICKMNLPEKNPPYTQSTNLPTEAPSSLFKVFKTVGRFIEASRLYINKDEKRFHYFVTVLESLYSDEAELLIAIKNRDLSNLYTNVTCDLFCETFATYNWLPKEVIDESLEKANIGKKLA